MENEFVHQICKPLSDKMDILKTNIEFLKSIKSDQSDSLEIIKKIDSRVNSMIGDVEELQGLLQEQQAIYNEMKVEEIEISHLLYKVNDLHMKNSEAQEPENNLQNGCNNSEQISSCVDFSPMILNNAPSTVSRKNLKPQSIAFDIAYLEENEYKLLPKYMLGRLTLEAINEFIDVINDAFSKKYNILSKRMSTLKTQEMKLFNKYKQQQNINLKATHFILEENIAAEFKKSTLEKKAYSFLTILRHTKRLRREQIDGVTVYIASSQ